MIDHMGISVASLDRSRKFYEKALAPLGYGLVERQSGRAGFGPPGRPLFWIAERGRLPSADLHFAFVAADRAAVDGFHAAALAAGGRDNGLPGLRSAYHPNYYGGFVLDPDGYSIEAVCHAPSAD